MKRFFVIVVTYRGHRWYERCFTSLRNSSLPLQTVVVDNASCDGTVEYIREYFPEIHLIESMENVGFGRANNLGIRYALDQGCEYVFLLNQDAWVEADTFETLVRVAEKNPEYGILSPIHLEANKKNIEKNFLSYIVNDQITDSLFVQDLYFGRMNDVYMSKFINAAGWLLPRNILDVVGGFDPIFYHYEEDDDYINRVLYHGFKIGIVPKSKMVHDRNTKKSNTFNENSVLRRRQFLLLRFTDINNDESYTGYCFYLMKRGVKSFLRGHWKQMKIYLSDFIFLCKMKEKIEFSRMKNRLRKSTWL